MEYFKVILSLLALLNCATMWGNDGDTFVAKSSEGVEMTFVVVSEAEKTCKVGVGIEGYTAIDKDQTGILTIPASVNNYSVVAIGAFAFSFCSIEEFLLPNTIKTIEEYAFNYTLNLKGIDIPESVETIGQGAFIDCKNLAHIGFHEGLKRIYANAFSYSGLTSVDFPKSLEYIDCWSFTSMPHLATVTIRSSVPVPHHEWRSVFSEDAYMRATLYVPQGTKDNFKTDNEWSRFRKIKEGEPLAHPTNIAYPEDFSRQYIVYGNPVTINVNFVNQRTNPISSISYIPIIDGIEGEEQIYEFPQPIAANGKPFTLPVTLPDFDEPKAVNAIIDITKLNGETVDFGADILPNACGTAAVFVPVPDHKVLIMDYTSNTCPWALRSNIGFEKLKERYGDKVIRASFHLTAPMWCEPYSYIPITPTCMVDGYVAKFIDVDDYQYIDPNATFIFDSEYNRYVQYVDPYYGEGSAPLGILDFVEEDMNRPHVGNLKILSAQWADEDQTSINVVTEVSLGMSGDNYNYPSKTHVYWIYFILVEDGLKGDGSEWEQLNGYAGQAIDDPNLQPLTQQPYAIADMVYDDVAVGHYYWLPILADSFTYGESQQITSTLQLSELTKSIIQDKSKLSIVGYIEDHEYVSPNINIGGSLIIDSDKSSISAYASDVRNIKKAIVPSDIYDLSGRKVKVAAATLDNLPKGIYIYGGKKIVVK